MESGNINETGIPIKFLVNGAQLNSTTFNLNSGAVDSAGFNWTLLIREIIILELYQH